MVGLLFVLLIVIPIAELYFIVQVGQSIGILPTLLLLIAMSVIGAQLLKREGMATWRRLQEAMRQGRVPTREATDGALILFGGALLLTPGFLTDIVGLIFVLPPTRAMVKGGFRKLLGAWAIKRMGPAGYVAGRVYDTKVTRTKQERGGATPGSRLPPSDEDDSRDRG
jgi:UPF0716 protein FxsA